MLLANESAVFVPVTGHWHGGWNRRHGARQSRTAEAENRGVGEAAGAGGVARRGQSRRVNSGSEITASIAVLVAVRGLAQEE